MNARPLPSPLYLLLFAAVALAAALLLRPADERQPISRWRPGESAAAPAPIAAEAVPVGVVAMQADDGLYAAERAELSAELDRALGYVSGRFGGALSGPVTAALLNEAGCGLSGIAYTDIRVVQVSTCQSIERGRAVAILAHELVHQLQQDRYGQPHLSADLILLEGMATWGAGEYWLGGAGSFREFVRPWLQAGEEIPLAESYVGRPISDMNKLYYEWASFVEFLIDTYGRDKFDQLYLTGDNSPASADYLGVYQKQFWDLEAEWRAWVLS